MPRQQGPAPSARAPRFSSATPSQPRTVLRRPWRCSLRRGAASVLHCAPRVLPLAGGASECCIGRLAVAKWILAPPTSSHGKGSGGRRALGRERAPGALAPRAHGQGRAQESQLGNVVLRVPLLSTEVRTVATFGTTRSSTAEDRREEKGRGKRGHPRRPPAKYPTAPLDTVFLHSVHPQRTIIMFFKELLVTLLTGNHSLKKTWTV
ncbi:uncharacterized protein LOC122487844 [Prionailurus bengalensis]|uniref:uncharacterized protein LOC122487844 n=1 Tax=Prionailurus bengalensis TaxID=37029 RepID=UPI001CAA3835|nr:uncharacterized protein LOC122487844 [Prionailurus bengalensis]